MFRDNGSTHEIVSLTQWHELAAHRRWLFDTVQGWSPRRREDDSRSIAEIIWAASILTCFSIFRPLVSLSLSLSFYLCLSRSLCLTIVLSSFSVCHPPFDSLSSSFSFLPRFRATGNHVTRGLHPHLGRLFVASVPEELFSTGRLCTTVLCAELSN